MARRQRSKQVSLMHYAEPLLERADQSVYILVAILFLAAAVAMGGYAIVHLLQNLHNDFPLQIISFVNALLLVLIIMEVLGTVRDFLATGTTSLRPFLYIGIISATRRILAIGAQTTLGEAASNQAFAHLMIDLGVNGAVVLALALALFLFSRGTDADAPALASADSPADTPPP